MPDLLQASQYAAAWSSDVVEGSRCGSGAPSRGNLFSPALQQHSAIIYTVQDTTIPLSHIFVPSFDLPSESAHNLYFYLYHTSLSSLLILSAPPFILFQPHLPLPFSPIHISSQNRASRIPPSVRVGAGASGFFLVLF